MYDKQVEYLKDQYKIIAYDHRGQGQSDVPKGRVISMDQLYEDALELIKVLDLGKVHFVGLSMGGFVGLRLAARNPEVIKSLCILDSSAWKERLSKRLEYTFWVPLLPIVGVGSASGQVMQAMFSPFFLRDRDRKKEKEKWLKEYMKNTSKIAAAVRGVSMRLDISDELSQISCPTVIMHGKQDTALPLKCGEFLHENIEGSEFHVLQKCGHTANVEQADKVNEILGKFLDKVTS